MRVLKDDVFSRRPRDQGRVRSNWPVIFLFVLISAVLLLLSRIQHPIVVNFRQTMTEIAAPALRSFAGPMEGVRRLTRHIGDYATASDEVARLRGENQRLKSWEARAQELERRLSDLAALARVVDEPALKFITGRVLADAGGPFARSVLFNGGRQNGVRSGFPVISSDGLVGRVLETGPRTARLLLLTDLNSRIPVLIGEQGTRAVMAGDNTGRPRLTHLAANARIEPGDQVTTSGVGGLFPRGLRIGTVQADKTEFRIVLHGRLDELEHVSVLFYDSPTLELADEPRVPAEVDPARRRTATRRTQAGIVVQDK